MLRVLVVTVVSMATAALVPEIASADMADCSKHLERSYSKHYHQVAHKHGTRAPGRNIRKHGVLFKRVVFNATCGEIRRSNWQLKRLLSSPRYGTLVRTAGPPPRPPAGVRTAGSTAGPVLESIAQCESGSNPATNTGNGFYGKYQFTLSTWASVGGSGNPAYASEAEQDMRAAMLYSREGPGPWPVCGR